jgi:hypothetical protein
LRQLAHARGAVLTRERHVGQDQRDGLARDRVAPHAQAVEAQPGLVEVGHRRLDVLQKDGGSRSAVAYRGRNVRRGGIVSGALHGASLALEPAVAHVWRDAPDYK